MSIIEDNLAEIKHRIVDACIKAGRSPQEITLVAVTKETDITAIKEAFELGVTDFGENRVQDAAVKIEKLGYLKPSIKWHMIGHLQRNKARQAASSFDIVHSVDSVKLAGILDRQVASPLPVLLQVNVSGESTKGGFTPDDVRAAYAEIQKMPNLILKGLMTIAPILDDAEQARPFFRKLRLLRDSMGLEHLSMGMTDDFEVAIEEGATLVRIGRAIFGQRRR